MFLFFLGKKNQTKKVSETQHSYQENKVHNLQILGNKFDAELNVINLSFSKTITICYISMPLNAKFLIGCMPKISLCNKKKLTKSPLYFFFCCTIITGEPLGA